MPVPAGVLEAKPGMSICQTELGAAHNGPTGRGQANRMGGAEAARWGGGGGSHLLFMKPMDQ